MAQHGKTQGYTYHKYLLGIACLIEDRIKPYAVVAGDITLEQIRESVAWVNSIVEKRVSTPDRCDYEKLLYRIRSFLKTEITQLESFLELILSPDNRQLGSFLMKNFSKETLKRYWADYFKDNKPGTIGMSNAIKKYLDMGFGIENLCDILVLNDDEKFMSIPVYIEEILNQRILEEEKNDDSLEINNQNSKTPETVESLFGKSLLSMAGLRDAANFFITETELKNILYKKFKNRNVIDEIFKEYYQKKGNFELPLQLSELLEKSRLCREDSAAQNNEKCDIETIDNLIFFKEGDVILSSLKDHLKKIDEISDNWIIDIKKDFFTATVEDRISALIRQNCSFFINKKTWDFIIKNASVDKVFYKVLSLLCVKAEEMGINTVMNSIFNNLQLLKTFL
jgi:hypothetical protein